MSKRIALLGSHATSIHLAPYKDPSWSIWACSPGAAWKVERCDEFFEIHHFNPADPNDPVTSREYLDKINTLNCTAVWMIEALPALVPKSVRYPKEEMVQKYGPYFFTSSLAWMFAKALEENPDEIGIWGVDMSAATEYASQRPAMHRFIHIARERGIKITVPPQSDLLQPPPLYGFASASRIAQKGESRRAELTRRIAEAEALFESKRADYFWNRGAVEAHLALMPKLQAEHAAEAEAKRVALEQLVASTQAEFEDAKSNFLFLKGALEDNDYYLATFLADYPQELIEGAPQRDATKLHVVT